MSAPVAAERAGITYRQLDYWERQGWVAATHVDEATPGGRRVRRYTTLDVARLATLRHLARSGFDIAVHGPTVGALDLEPGVVVVAGGDPETVRLVAVEHLAAAVTVEGRWSVFDPTELLTPAVTRLRHRCAPSPIGEPHDHAAPRTGAAEAAMWEQDGLDTATHGQARAKREGSELDELAFTHLDQAGGTLLKTHFKVGAVSVDAARRSARTSARFWVLAHGNVDVDRPPRAGSAPHRHHAQGHRRRRRPARPGRPPAAAGLTSHLPVHAGPRHKAARCWLTGAAVRSTWSHPPTTCAASNGCDDTSPSAPPTPGPSRRVGRGPVEPAEPDVAGWLGLDA